MSGVNSLHNVTSTVAATLGSSGSLQFQFAALQLALSQMSKNGALDHMQAIQGSQEEQKKVASMIQGIRDLKENGCERTVTMQDGRSVTISSENVLVNWETSKYMIDNGLAVTGDIEKYKATYALDVEAAKATSPAFMYTSITNGVQVPTANLDILIESLQAKLDTIGTDTQQQMIYVQDFMGQYNSYLTGSNSIIQQANTTLGELARAR